VLPALASVLLPILIGAIDGGEAYWGARHDPTWETRWRSLDPAERAWLAVIATSRNWLATLTDPEEIRLAKGRRSAEGRRRLKADLWALPVFIAASVLVLADVLNVQVLFFVLLVFGLIRGIWTYRRERLIKEALNAQRELAGETASHPRSARWLAGRRYLRRFRAAS
jgi:Flp pilus assembly protein TadB